jgi:hypothetical protein
MQLHKKTILALAASRGACIVQLIHFFTQLLLRIIFFSHRYLCHNHPWWGGRYLGGRSWWTRCQHIHYSSHVGILPWPLQGACQDSPPHGLSADRHNQIGSQCHGEYVHKDWSCGWSRPASIGRFTKKILKFRKFNPRSKETTRAFEQWRHAEQKHATSGDTNNLHTTDLHK